LFEEGRGGIGKGIRERKRRERAKAKGKREGRAKGLMHFSLASSHAPPT